MRLLLWSASSLAIALAVLGAIWFANAGFWSNYRAPTTVLAHRGMAQTYHREWLERDTCTAIRINLPEHGYLENTIESMEAAFAAGADVVEFDVHPTTDGQFAVFHDWTLECRTDGAGVTRDQSTDYLKSLDIGYGYTADGGRSFPFRGKFVGAMPTLDEVLARFPNKRFLINTKSRDPREGKKLAARLRTLPPARRALLMTYGGDAPEAAIAAALPELKAMGKKRLKACLVDYVKIGWMFRTPAACRNTIILVPANYAFLLWGWPNRFVERMHAAGSEVYLAGRYDRGDPGTSGIDSIRDLRFVPRDFPGGVWTNRVDIVAPAVKRRV
ncbi:MAG: hypothetical protein K2Q06_10660, partial [Parvularculaceae bacterium]|nr:hypothetical protein [Parvularculaceae bacterium]